jgi:metal-responsive CopG/Arc/MetJ family transcriptional regulator
VLVHNHNHAIKQLTYSVRIMSPDSEEDEHKHMTPEIAICINYCQDTESGLVDQFEDLLHADDDLIFITYKLHQSQYKCIVTLVYTISTRYKSPRNHRCS